MNEIAHRIFPSVSISILFWILVALNFADYGLTSAIISAGGSEANPYVDWYIQHFGVVGILIAKLIPTFIFFFVLYFRWDGVRHVSRPYVKGSLYALNVMYTIVIIYSIWILTNLTT